MDQDQTTGLKDLVDQATMLTRSLLTQGCDEFGIAAPRVRILFDLRGKTAGQVRLPARGQPVIRYNAVLLAENGRRFLNRTVPHETAHVVAFWVFGSGIRPHGAEWKRVMELFGADTRRCHDYDTSRSATRRLTLVTYHCGCREHRLTRIRHNRILTGQVYCCTACGTFLQLGPKTTG